MNEVQQDSCKNADSSHIALVKQDFDLVASLSPSPAQVSLLSSGIRSQLQAAGHSYPTSPPVCLLSAPHSATLAGPALRMPGSQVSSEPLHSTSNMPGLMILFIFKILQLCTLPL